MTGWLHNSSGPYWVSKYTTLLTHCVLLPPVLRVAALQLGVAKSLRTLVAYLLSAAATTMNLPPIAAAPRLWEAVGIRLR